MNSVLRFAKSSVSTALSVKQSAQAALHPVQWVKDQMLGLLTSAMLSALTKTIGPELTTRTVERLDLVDKTLPFSLSLSVPSALQSWASGEGLDLAQTVANEVLAGPLEVLGYRLAKVAAQFDPGTGKLQVQLEAGVMRLATTAPVSATSALSSPRP